MPRNNVWGFFFFAVAIEKKMTNLNHQPEGVQVPLAGHQPDVEVLLPEEAGEGEPGLPGLAATSGSRRWRRPRRRHRATRGRDDEGQQQQASKQLWRRHVVN